MQTAVPADSVSPTALHTAEAPPLTKQLDMGGNEEAEREKQLSAVVRLASCMTKGHR